MQSLKWLVDKALQPPVDSSRHLISLCALALSLGARNMLEFGVKDGDSSEALLCAAELIGGNASVTGVDIRESIIAGNRHADNPRWTYLIMDAVQFLENLAPGEIFDLVFVDDWHDGPHVLKELALLENMCARRPCY